MFFVSSTTVSCQSKTQNKEMNTSINQLKMKEQFPNKIVAFEKINEKINFYKPSGSKILTIDLQTNKYTFFDSDEIYSKYLIKVNDFLYFLPKVIKQNYTLPIGASGTASGGASTEYSTNDLGLITTIQKDFAENKSKAEFTYNKYAQLLKIVDNGKVVVENKYDDNGNISEIKTSSIFIKNQYDAYGKITKVEANENGKKNVLNYYYNSSGMLEKVQSHLQNFVKEFQYDSAGKIKTITEYSAAIDKNETNKLINHFIKKTYKYDGELVIEETKTEYSIANVSVLLEQKWQSLSIEEQRILAWKKFNDNSETPLSEIERKYLYTLNEINVIENKYVFSNRIKQNKTEMIKDMINSEKIKYISNNIGKIIKKETNDSKNIIVDEYRY